MSRWLQGEVAKGFTAKGIKQTADAHVCTLPTVLLLIAYTMAIDLLRCLD